MVARRLITALLFALTISGLFTFWLSRKYSKPVAAAPLTYKYVATAAAIEAGDIVRPTGLKVIEWPAASPLEGAFLKPEDVAGRIVLFPLAANEPILERQLSAPGSGAGLSMKIPDGMRAISLKSNEVVGVSGFLTPGSHVDVIVTYHHPLSPDPSTTTILQDVQIIAAGQKIQPDPEGKATTVDVVTLLVKPQDAERVVLASSLGSVQFVLRNGSDREQMTSSPIQLAELDGPSGAHTQTGAQTQRRPGSMSGHSLAHPVVSPTASYQVETILGTKQSVESFK